MLKKALLLLVIALLILCIWQWNLIAYGLQQGKGQLKVIVEAKTIEEFLDDSEFPDSLKSKLRVIKDIRRFAIDSLGINDTDNYSSMFDQHGDVTLWNLTACQPYELEAYQWSFPMLGSFPYKGFFDIERAREEEQELKSLGYDTQIRPVNGWSTLGWFNDPILSDMLYLPVGHLADLIIHELTHGTLYIKDSASYNENLASFIGEKGAEKFLAQKFGANSIEWIAYEADKEDFKKFSSHFIRGSKALDSLYTLMRTVVNDEIKAERKQRMILNIINAMDTISFAKNSRYLGRFQNSLPNNTFFMSFLRYYSKQNDFEKDFQGNFNGNIRSYLTYLKEKYPSL
ncbi:MAG: aminopeptidase [Bacteroidetes bacterium]|nr:aminopeptidase [Bacteroidota bacterium]MDA1118924.1 aminopeptidase [Bacteroidota bacterium]